MPNLIVEIVDSATIDLSTARPPLLELPPTLERVRSFLVAAADSRQRAAH